MKELVVNIVNVNWGEVGLGDWLSNEWEIYTDLTVEKKTRYKGNEEVVVKNSKISCLNCNFLCYFFFCKKVFYRNNY